MKISNDIPIGELPQLVNGLMQIVPWSIWKGRIDNLVAMSKSNPLWPEYLEEKHSLELALDDVRRYVQNTGRYAWPPRTAGEYRFYSFVAAIVKAYANLSQKAQNRLAGSIRSGLEKEYGLGPVAFEMKTAQHLMSQGFDVEFHDLENDGGFDFLALSGETALEVECKHISADVGRLIHRRKLHSLAGLIYPITKAVMGTKTGGYHLRIQIPDRLTGQIEYTNAIVARIKEALQSGKEINDNLCEINIETFNIAESPFSSDRGSSVTLSYLKGTFCKELGIETNHVLFNWRPGKVAIVISFTSLKPDAVLTKILSRLKDDAKRQFTGSKPAFLLVHLADLSEEQLLDIAAEDNAGKPTGIKLVLNKLLQDRPHIHTVALMTDGSVKEGQRQVSNLLTTSVQESGPAYTFQNPNHPEADNTILKAIFKPV